MNTITWNADFIRSAMIHDKQTPREVLRDCVGVATIEGYPKPMLGSTDGFRLHMFPAPDDMHPGTYKIHDTKDSLLLESDDQSYPNFGAIVAEVDKREQELKFVPLGQVTAATAKGLEKGRLLAAFRKVEGDLVFLGYVPYSAYSLAENPDVIVIKPVYYNDAIRAMTGQAIAATFDKPNRPLSLKADTMTAVIMPMIPSK